MVVVVEVVVVEVESVKGSSVSISATTGSIGKRNKLIDDAVVCAGTDVGAVTDTGPGEVAVVNIVCVGTDVGVEGESAGEGVGDGTLSPGLVPYSYTLNFSDPIPPDLLLNGT